MCEAVLAIAVAAWDGALGGAADDEVTAEVTVRVTVYGPTNEKPPTTLGEVGGQMEREKGFEPAEAAHANRATGHANPHDSPEPQRVSKTSFSAPVLSRPHPSPDSVEAAWRRNNLPDMRPRGGRAVMPTPTRPWLARRVRLRLGIRAQGPQLGTRDAPC